jgi:hypothetical protein
MSGGDRVIVCRRCGEVVSTDLDGCPHCGAEIHGVKLPIGSLIVGLVIMAASATNIGRFLPYLAVGFLFAFGGAYFLYDRYKRQNEARSKTADL